MITLFHLPRHTGEAGRGKATGTACGFPPHTSSPV
jgi:hypothetical protein